MATIENCFGFNSAVSIDVAEVLLYTRKGCLLGVVGDIVIFGLVEGLDWISDPASSTCDSQVCWLDIPKHGSLLVVVVAVSLLVAGGLSDNIWCCSNPSFETSKTCGREQLLGEPVQCIEDKRGTPARGQSSNSVCRVVGVELRDPRHLIRRRLLQYRISAHNLDNRSNHRLFPKLRIIHPTPRIAQKVCSQLAQTPPLHETSQAHLQVTPQHPHPPHLPYSSTTIYHSLYQTTPLEQK